MFRLYVIYHKYINDAFLKCDPTFNHDEIHLLKTVGYTGEKPKDYPDYITITDTVFPHYNAALQKKKYFAPSVIYHMYKHDVYDTPYVGFMEYDSSLQLSKRDVQKIKSDVNLPQNSVSEFLRQHLKDNCIIGLSCRWYLNDLYKQAGIKVGQSHWLDFYITEYNKFYTTPINKTVLLKENPLIITQQSFICNVEIFKKIMKFVAYLIDSGKLDQGKPRPATVLDRIIGLTAHLTDATMIYVPLEHHNHRNW